MNQVNISARIKSRCPFVYAIYVMTKLLMEGGLPAFPACGHALGFNQTKVNTQTVKTGDVNFDGEEEKKEKKEGH